MQLDWVRSRKGAPAVVQRVVRCQNVIGFFGFSPFFLSFAVALKQTTLAFVVPSLLSRPGERKNKTQKIADGTVTKREDGERFVAGLGFLIFRFLIICHLLANTPSHLLKLSCALLSYF